MKGLVNKFKERNIFSFIVTWVLFAIVLWWRHHSGKVEIINTTSLAFTYEYGFISRGFMGTIFSFVDWILPGNLMNYDGVMGFTFVATMLYFALLLGFFLICLTKCNISMVEKTKFLTLFFTLYAVSMFVTKYNYGRFDMYCLMLSIISAMLIIYEKAEWLVIPLSAFSIMIHQGNVFYLLNIILILLLYKAFSTEGVKRRKYVILLGVSFIVSSALFLYFEFFSRSNGHLYYEEIIKVAKSLGFEGKIHQDIIDHEILGIDLADRETIYRYKNFVEFPFFCLFNTPYIYIAIVFFKNLIKNAESTLDKWKYFFVAVGSATIIPALIMKCDFGRWMFMIIAYYFVVILSLIAMKDTLVEKEVKNIADRIKKLGVGAWVLLSYPVLMVPFKDVLISQLSYNVADKLNELFLHLWQ